MVVLRVLIGLRPVVVLDLKRKVIIGHHWGGDRKLPLVQVTGPIAAKDNVLVVQHSREVSGRLLINLPVLLAVIVAIELHADPRQGRHCRLLASIEGRWAATLLLLLHHKAAPIQLLAVHDAWVVVRVGVPAWGG